MKISEHLDEKVYKWIFVSEDGFYQYRTCEDDTKFICSSSWHHIRNIPAMEYRSNENSVLVETNVNLSPIYVPDEESFRRLRNELHAFHAWYMKNIISQVVPNNNLSLMTDTQTSRGTTDESDDEKNEISPKVFVDLWQSCCTVVPWQTVLRIDDCVSNDHLPSNWFVSPVMYVDENAGALVSIYNKAHNDNVKTGEHKHVDYHVFPNMGSLFSYKLHTLGYNVQQMNDINVFVTNVVIINAIDVIIFSNGPNKPSYIFQFDCNGDDSSSTS